MQTENLFQLEIVQDPVFIQQGGENFCFHMQDKLFLIISVFQLPSELSDSSHKQQ